uniref:Uncharacterized protein n=1 Tax=Rhizophora mucronata TaxID=61149 RepID=A0A2P2P1W6_RHIMU
MLFDVIQTVFGAPINQKSFHIWKGDGNSFFEFSLYSCKLFGPSTFLYVVLSTSDHKSNSGLSYPLRSNALAVLKSMNSDSCTQSSSALTFSCLQTTLIRLELGSKDMVLSQIF